MPLSYRDHARLPQLNQVLVLVLWWQVRFFLGFNLLVLTVFVMVNMLRLVVVPWGTQPCATL